MGQKSSPSVDTKKIEVTMFTNVIIPILLFGALVFFHELGHFTVAKLCGVFVERFAIGFGPAILRKRIGETEYAICAFPLGGYVKMRGQEDLPNNVEEAQKTVNDPRSFASQNVWKRIAIVIMGPTANFILPIVVFTVLFLVGMPTPSTKIGNVAPDSPAAMAGLLPGDKILQVNHQDVQTWNDLNKTIQNRANMETEIVVQRDNQPLTFQVTPKLADDRNEFNEAIQSGKIGIDMVSYKPVIGVSDLNSKAYKSGLRTGDVITMVNQKPVQYWWQIHQEMQKNGDKKLTVQRGEKTLTSIEFDTPEQKISNTGIEPGELFINKVVEKSIAEEKGMLAGDKIDSINGQKLARWSDFRDTIMKNNGEAMKVGLIRSGKPVVVDITPDEVTQRNEVTNEKKKVRQLGVISESGAYPIDFYREKYTNVFKAFSRGFGETLTLTKQTFVGLGKLVTGKLPANSLGGPISIFYLAGTSYESGGWNSFFRLMALLSITLAALNILPIPVLDGGHLFFFLIEAVKGSPVRPKVQAMAMQVGFYLLMGLMVFVFYVDINRFFVDKIKALF